MSDELGPPANPDETCMAPIGEDYELCGDHATEQRVISGVVFALCDACAEAVDKDEDE